MTIISNKDLAITNGRPINKIIKRVFNPYDKKEYDDLREDSGCIRDLPLVCRFDYRIIASGGKLFSTEINNFIYVYRIPAYAAGLSINNAEKLTFHEGAAGEERVAMAFFDKRVEALFLDKINKNNVISKEETIENRFQHYIYNLWGLSASQINKDRKKLLWNVVPREIFKDFDDYAYLFICCVGDPKVKMYTFPLNRLFFWDLPAVTSLYEDEKLNDNQFILGDVKRIDAPVKTWDLLNSNNNIVLSNMLKTIKGSYSWKAYISKDNLLKTQLKNLRKTCNVITTDNYVFKYSGEDYLCPSIDIYVYKKNRGNYTNAKTAYVWQSGNEDDRIKESYFDGNMVNDYCFIKKSLSLNTIYGSFASLTAISPEMASRYVVRYLATQPKGERSISIEGTLTFLMGGALFCLEEEMVNNKNFDADYINALFFYNGSMLYYDSPVTYERPNEYIKDSGLQAAYLYLHDVLGINAGSNGCRRTKELLTKLFKAISNIGIQVDHIFCDIENLSCEVFGLRNRRFSSSFFDFRNYDVNKYPLIYNQLLLREVCGRKEIYDELCCRGYYFGSDYLKDVATARETEGLFDNSNNINSSAIFYGVARNAPFENRRNPNIWNAVMKEYIDTLFYDNIFAPALLCWPNAKCSANAQYDAKGYINWADSLETQLGGTVKLSNKMYSCVGTYGGGTGRGYKKHTMDNWKMYPNVPTAFSILIGDIQCVRASIISSNMKTVVFVPSWNIWASPLNKLKGFYSNKITDDNVTGEPKTKDVEYLELTKKYYRESIYHTFLHCPDDVVAYFSTEPTRKEDYYIRLSGKYNDLSNVIDKYIYYRDSYDVLQDILTSINYLIGNKVIKSLNDVLADESLPFVISGVNAGKTNIWRITFDDAYVFSIAKASRSGIRFNICGKEVFFEKGIINNENKSELGYWIETPAEVIPKISTSTEKYYKDNAAYACNCVEERGLEGKKGVIKYSYYNSHTVFGDIPRSQIIEFCFKPISLLDKYTCVFYQNSFNETPNKEDEHIHVRIGPEKNKYKNKGNSMLFRISKDNNIVDGTKCYVEVGKIYKLVLRIDYNSETDASIINRTISFTLFSEDNAEQIISQYSFDNSFTNPSRKKIITSLITLLYPQCNNILDYIKIEDFRIYFEKRFEKLEVFRERDGVNVTKVNKTNHVYADLPVQTLSSDKLIGKITWMNPTNAEVSYKVLYRKNNKSVSRFMCKSSVVIFPEDGRITSDIQQFKDSGMFSVAPQSEGYILFDLPKNGIQTDSIEIGLCLLERSKILTRTRERAFLPQHYKATVLEDYLIPIEPL